MYDPANLEEHMTYPLNLPPHSLSKSVLPSSIPSLKFLQREPKVERDDFAWYKKPHKPAIHRVLITEQGYHENTCDWWFKLVDAETECRIEDVPDLVSEEWLFKQWQLEWGPYRSGR